MTAVCRSDCPQPLVPEQVGVVVKPGEGRVRVHHVDPHEAHDQRIEQREQAHQQQQEDGRRHQPVSEIPVRIGAKRQRPIDVMCDPLAREELPARRNGRAGTETCRDDYDYWIGARLRRPVGINRLLLVDADLLGDRVPFAGGRIENRLRILARPQLRHRLAQHFLVLVGLQQRQIEQTVLGARLERREVILGIRPLRQIPGLVKCEVAERITQRVRQLHPLMADFFAVQPLDEQIGGFLVLGGRGDREGRSPPPVRGWPPGGMA